MNILQFELFEPLQSAYKARHSCETSLIHVQNNILCAMDQGKVGILLLLDISATFETVDHRTLLNRLRTELGIEGLLIIDFGLTVLIRKKWSNSIGWPLIQCQIIYADMVLNNMIMLYEYIVQII